MDNGTRHPLATKVLEPPNVNIDTNGWTAPASAEAQRQPRFTIRTAAISGAIGPQGSESVPIDSAETAGHITLTSHPQRGPGTLASRALVLGPVLIAVSAIVAVILVALFAQANAGAAPAFEFWFAAPLFLVASMVFLGAGLYELSLARPVRVQITPDRVLVRHAMPLPRPRAIPRTSDALPRVQQRRHTNYAILTPRVIPIHAIRTYVRYAGRPIGPMSEADAERLVAAMTEGLDAIPRAAGNTAS